VTEALSKRRLKTWIRLLRATRVIESELRDYVRVEHASTLPRFDVLAALYRVNQPITMGELSRRLLVSNGNATAVVDRLVNDGLVRRLTPEHDRRVVRVQLTEVGRRRFEDLAAPHEARVSALFQSLDSRDLDRFDALLHRLERGLVHERKAVDGFDG
jgi:DNA-binding MarR family transcriptional regulator